jgi:DNA-binding transcriptional LysR family regulator
MRVFEGVARLESICRASGSLNVSQPAISQAIAKLESRFRVKLLERNKSGALPTEHGEILLFRVRRMHTLMVQAIRQFLAEVITGPRLDAQTILTQITLTQIRSLVAVSENQSFEHAARSIEVSQPSVHRAARDLENLLGRPLYVRGPRGVTTTKPGGLLARRLNLALREIRYAFEEVNHRNGTVNSSIMIGTLSTSGALLLSRAVETLLATYPSLCVNVIEEPYEHLLKDLLRGNIDFLFGVLRRPEWAQEVAEEMLYRDDYVVVARPGHPLCKSRALNRADLSQYKWTIPGSTTPRYCAFRSLFGNYSPAINVITASRAMTRALITGSDRLTLLTRHEAEAEQHAGVMTILPFDCNIPAPAYGVATRMAWAPTAIHLQLLEVLRATARRDVAGYRLVSSTAVTPLRPLPESQKMEGAFERFLAC